MDLCRLDYDFILQIYTYPITRSSILNYCVCVQYPKIEKILATFFIFRAR